MTSRTSRLCFAKWLAAAWLAGLGACKVQAIEITIACGPSGSDVAFCLKHAQAWAARTGHSIRNFSPPSSPTEKLSLYRQLFAAQSSDLDVIQIDTVWPGLLKDHLVDLKPYSKNAEAQHFPAMVANNTVNGRLLGMPWYTDAGLLYYRSDLLKQYGLKVPQTWAELTATARTIQAGERSKGARDFYGYVFQAKAYEGLSCNALEWVASHGGGAVVNSAGEITIANPQAVAALRLAASWVGDIAPVGVLNYEEEEARGVFQNGKALFMRNWPYAWALVQKGDSPIRGKVGVAPLPGAPHSAATLGGWQLAVSRYAKHPEVAADLVMYMTSAQVQKERAIAGSFNPTISSLYKDPDILAANAFMASLSQVFAQAVARPTTATALKYPQVSQSFWNAAHEVMSRQSTPEEAVATLDKRLHQIKRKAW
jgi:trehalose/maltose transport system substrate-binding protein